MYPIDSRTLIGVCAAVILVILGISHCVLTGSVLRDFKTPIVAHQRIFRMTWIMQGAFYLFIALVVLVSMAFERPDTALICRVTACCLFVAAGVITMTGAKSEVIIVRAAPLIQIVCAFLLLAAAAQSRSSDFM